MYPSTSVSSSKRDRSINYGLGIDTGGTYTDAAIVNLDTIDVLTKAKARTTHHDLSLGLSDAVDEVIRTIGDEGFKPSLVGVSTTLATNTVLEGKGARVGLIGLGWSPEEGKDHGAKKQFFFPGGHDARGRMQASLDRDSIRGAVVEMSRCVDAMVVSGMFSVYNPQQELEVKTIITDICGLPVVMGHELTGELGIYERTVTAVINASLIPVLSSFLGKVEDIMRDRGFNVPIMVFKGDGTLMNVKAARKRPVDTLLSGPAASAMGGMLLSQRNDCIVVDMGGTSTDIAIVENGRTKITKEGAVVGSWHTRVEAVNAWTVGLGGDSEIRLSKRHGLKIGPYRVTPLCFASKMFPDLVERMRCLGEARFLAASPLPCRNLAENEQVLLDHLRINGPQSIGELKGSFEEMYLIDRHIGSLWRQGAIEGIGLTPTDVLHAEGSYNLGDRGASELGLRIYAIALNMEDAVLRRTLIAMVSSRIAEELMKKAISEDLGEVPHSHALHEIISGISGRRSFSHFRVNVALTRPLIGLGGPAKAFIAPLEGLLGAEVIIPDDFEVGNAIGAVCGQVSEYVDVFVYPEGKGFAVYSVFSTPIYYTMSSDALEKAKEMATYHALLRAKEAGGIDPQVEVTVEVEREESGSVLCNDSLLQMRVRARAAAAPLDL